MVTVMVMVGITGMKKTKEVKKVTRLEIILWAIANGWSLARINVYEGRGYIWLKYNNQANDEWFVRPDINEKIFRDMAKDYCHFHKCEVQIFI